MRSPLQLCQCRRQPQQMDQRKEERDYRRDISEQRGLYLYFNAPWLSLLSVLDKAGYCVDKNPFRDKRSMSQSPGWWLRRLTHSFPECTPKVSSSTPASSIPASIPAAAPQQHDVTSEPYALVTEAKSHRYNSYGSMFSTEHLKPLPYIKTDKKKKTQCFFCFTEQN